MKKLRIDTIVLEGVDKTGKDTILKYIDIIGKHKYAVYQRGLISNATYSEIYNREFDKDMYNLNEHTLYVLLTADFDDFRVRFKINNEPYTDIQKDSEYFQKVFYEMTDGFYKAEYNTSEMTAYKIALDILYLVESINKEYA